MPEILKRPLRFHAAKTMELIYNMDEPRAVFLTPSGDVRKMNTHGSHFRGALDDQEKMACLVGVYDSRASEEMILADLEYMADLHAAFGIKSLILKS